MKCIKGYEIEVLKSAVGYYLGTLDEEGFPNCRISTKYTSNRNDAMKNLKYDRQDSFENMFCNGGCGCFNFKNN